MNSDKTSRDILIGHGSAGNNVEGAANNDLQHEDETPVEDWSTAGIGNAFLFGGLLATLPEQEVFEAFESSLHQSSEGNRSNSFPHFFG